MPLKRTLLLDEESRNDSDTKTLTIPAGMKISALQIAIKGTNGTTSNRNNDISTIVSRVSVKASDVGYICNFGDNVGGINCQLVSFYRTKRVPGDYLSEVPSDVQRGEFLILFGRELGDRTFALDTNRVRNVQLNITSNLGANTAVGVSSFTSATKYIQVVAWEFVKENVNPIGCIGTRELKDFTTAGSGKEPVDLTGAISRQVAAFYIRAFEDGVALSTSLTKVKMEGFVDDEKIEYLMDANAMQFGSVEVSRKVFLSNNDTFVSRVGEPTGISLDSSSSPYIVGYFRQAGKISAGDKFAVSVYENAVGITAAGTDMEISASVRGKAYHNSICIPLYGAGLDYSNLPRPQDLPDKMWLTQGNADARCTVLVDEVFVY